MKYTLPIEVESDLILEYFSKEPIRRVFDRAIDDKKIASLIQDYLTDIFDYLMTEEKNRSPEDIAKEVEKDLLFNIKLNMFLAANSCVLSGNAFYDYERRLAAQIYMLSKDKNYLETIVKLCGEAILRTHMQRYNPEAFEEMQEAIRSMMRENEEKQQAPG